MKGSFLAEAKKHLSHLSDEEFEAGRLENEARIEAQNIRYCQRYLNDELPKMPIKEARKFAREFALNRLKELLEMRKKKYIEEPRQTALLHDLVAIRMQDEEYCNDNDFNIHKGCLLMGGVGLSKTLCMRAVSLLPGQARIMDIFGAKQLEADFRKNGESGLISKAKLSPNDVCLDDLSYENEAQNYGNRITMGEVIFIRNEVNERDASIRFFATSNDLPPELKTNYGDRIYRRIKRLCNFILLSDDFPDFGDGKPKKWKER